MASSRAQTPQAYLAELPDDRRRDLAAVRAVIVKRLPKGYRETMGYGMISYCIPLEDFPDTDNKQPLCYAALAAQKNYNALYLMTAYGSASEAAWLREAFRKAGKKLDMGKSCIRFKSADDLPLEAIGEMIGRTPPAKYIEAYQASRRQTARTKPRAGRKPAGAKVRPSS
jgi:hypothetical protein